MGAIIKAFERLNEQNTSIFLSCCSFKNPDTNILISIFLGMFGIDSFITGNIGKVFRKLICSIILICLIFIPTDNIIPPEFISDYNKICDKIIIILGTLLSISWVSDICTINGITKKTNLKILARNFHDYFGENIFKNYFEYKKHEDNGNGNEIYAGENEQKLKDELNALKTKNSELEDKLKNDKEQTVEIAKKMKKNGINDKYISEITGLNLQEVENITV